MINPSDKRYGRAGQSGDDVGLREKLDKMPVAELTEAMELALDTMTEDTYSSELIDAYLEALERKSPIADEPDVEEAYAGFQRHLRQLVLDSSDCPAVPAKPRGIRRAVRIGSVAAIAIICMFGCMIVAQAAGADVFGAMARWTDTVFSFGKITSDGAVDTPLNPSEAEPGRIVDEEAEYATLQEALDALGIAEVQEPSWFPEDYVLNKIDIMSVGDKGDVYLRAEYMADGRLVSFIVRSYTGEPGMQIEKTETPVKTFESGGTVFYLIENINNYTVAWATAQFACYIAGTIPDELVQIASSIY